VYPLAQVQTPEPPHTELAVEHDRVGFTQDSPTTTANAQHNVMQGSWEFLIACAGMLVVFKTMCSFCLIYLFYDL